jgi:hemoglobin/transferrin/lactoferrin receptor protein
MKLDSIGVPTLSVRGAIAYAKGEDKDTDEPINTVQPLTGVIGLSYRSNNDVWGGDLIWTGVQAKDASDISGSALYATSGYGILDLMGEFSFNQALSINFGVFNLTDKSYIRWADSPGIGRDAAQRFTQPGVNYSVGIKYEL